jgi:hypothetical protein
MIERAIYTYADSERWVTAVLDGVEWQLIDLESDLMLAQAVNAWVDDGNEIDPNEDGRLLNPPPPDPPPSPPPDPVVVQMKYRAKTLTTDIADPGNTFIAWNTAAQVDASKLAVSARTDDGLDQSMMWRNAVGLAVIIQYATNAAQAEHFAITGVTDNGTWFDVDVSPVSAAGGAFSGNNPLYVVLTSAATATKMSKPAAQTVSAKSQTTKKKKKK